MALIKGSVVPSSYWLMILQVGFVTQLHAHKLIWKFHKDECPIGVIFATEPWIDSMTWVDYLMNEFIEDYVNV